MNDVSPNIYWIGLALVLITSIARLTRLITVDSFPPVKAIRDAWFDFTDTTEKRRKWQILAFCGYCMSFWVAVVVFIWGDLAGVFDGKPAFGPTWMPPLWWLLNGMLGVSYLAAILMASDRDDDDEKVA